MGRPARARPGRLTHRAPPGRPYAAGSAGAASPPCQLGSSPGPGTRTCSWSGFPAWPRPAGAAAPRAGGASEQGSEAEGSGVPAGTGRVRARRPVRKRRPGPTAPPCWSASRDHVTGGAATSAVRDWWCRPCDPKGGGQPGGGARVRVGPCGGVVRGGPAGAGLWWAWSVWLGRGLHRLDGVDARPWDGGHVQGG